MKHCLNGQKRSKSSKKWKENIDDAKKIPDFKSHIPVIASTGMISNEPAHDIMLLIT